MSRPLLVLPSRKVAMLPTRKLASGEPTCAGICCGDPPDPTCDCYCQPMLVECGLGPGIARLCICPPEFHFEWNYEAEETVTITTVSDSFNARTGEASHCGPITRTTRRLWRWTLRIQQRCVDGHVVSSFDGSSYHYESFDSNLPVQEPPIDLADWAAATSVGIPNPCGWQGPNSVAIGYLSELPPDYTPCGFNYRAEVRWPSDPYFRLGELDTCGNDTGWSYPPPWQPAPGDRTIGVLTIDARSTRHASCAGGSMEEFLEGNVSVNKDVEAPDGSFHRGNRTERVTYTADTNWSYAADSSCRENPCGSLGVGACCGTFFIFGSPRSCIETSRGMCVSLRGAYQGDNTTCTSAGCPPVGACCHYDGACEYTTEPVCFALHGQYQGDGARCAAPYELPCSESGACCLQDGTCLIRTRGACEALNGAYLGDDTTCTGTPCEPRGACCVRFGIECYENETQQECAAHGGVAVWSPGTDCVPWCLPGAPRPPPDEPPMPTVVPASLPEDERSVSELLRSLG